MATFQQGLLPLPPGWTEYKGPDGIPFYHNLKTSESTYIRPSPAPTSVPVKKEKPLYKIPIPSSPWLRIKTTHGNIFFTHSETKQSIWTVPDEVKDLVQDMDWGRLEEQAAQEKEEKERAKEVARILAETAASGATKRKAEDESTPGEMAEVDSKPKKKKKRSKEVPVEDQALDELIIIEAPVEEVVQGDEEEQDDDDDDASDAFSTAEAEEAWQQEMAAGLAKLAAEGPSKAGSAPPEDNEASPPDEAPSFTVPEKVNLSTEEATALFKTLLTEKNPSPLAPFASVIPLLVTDPRYVLLPSQHDRENAFNDWARDVSRAKRLAKTSAVTLPSNGSLLTSVEAESSVTAAAALTKEEEKARARTAYDALLKEEVTSTRTTWDDFRRKWKKDRRFFGFGRDDREREKVFKSWMKDLSERKRAAARKAELDFMALLKENAAKIPITPNSVWKDAKKPLIKDPRYDAVGSSSLREELFGTFLKALSSSDPSDVPPVASSSASTPLSKKEPEDRKARAERALKAREEQAKASQQAVQRDIGRSRAILGSVEGERELMSFYVDAVRDPLFTYGSLESTFAAHPRFTSSSLPSAQKIALFNKHILHLRQKHQASLDALLLSASPSLATSSYSSLPELNQKSLESSLPAQKLGLKSDGSIERAFDEWMSRRTVQARADFQTLLEENSFVEFWGKVKHLESKKNSEDAGVIGQMVGPGEEDRESGGAGYGSARGDDDEVGEKDLMGLAKGIGLEEVERVLKNDARYRTFDHMPEERLRWLKDYLSSLSAPKLSVHQQ